MTFKDYKNLWTSIPSNPKGNLLRRIDGSHPLNLFIGYDEESRMMFVLITDRLPRIPLSSKQIIVRSRFRKDKKYAVRFSLVDDKYKDVFITLTWDIYIETVSIPDKIKGTERLLIRFSMWQQLLEKGKVIGNDVKGFIGELLILRDYCFPKYGIRESVLAWSGPKGTDRDFEFEDTWIEVKTVSLSASTVKISSFEQLDSSLEGSLLVCRLEKSSALTPESITLHKLVTGIEHQLSFEPDSLHIFQSMTLLKINEKNSESNEEAYILHRIEEYRVTQTFPKIRREDVSEEIVNGTYSLNIPMIQKWREV